MNTTESLRQSRIARTLIVPILVMFFLCYAAHAQDCNMIGTSIDEYPAGTTFVGSEIVLPAVRVGVPASFVIPINTTGFSSSIYAEVGSCDDITDNHMLVPVGNTLQVTVNKRCPLGMENYLSFTYKVVKDGCNDELKMFKIPVIRDSAKIVLALDISGSMGLNVAGTSDKRIDALKTSVNAFIPKLEEFRVDGDSLGLTYFSSETYEPASTYFDKDFVEITSNEEPVLQNYSSYKVSSDLGTRSPMQMTAMGLGLINARDKLLNNNRLGSNTQKMVFLFTDGLQNYGPLVNVDGNSLSNNDSLNHKSGWARDSVRYFTIATWEAGYAPEILNTIATKSGGSAMHVFGDAPELNDWFNTNLYNLLNDGSPQIVFVNKGQQLKGSTSVNFKLNKNIAKLLIEVFSANDDSISLKLTKGTNVITPIKITDGKGYRLYSFRFPQSVASNVSVDSGGDWVLTLTGRSALPYTVTAIVDDHLFKYNCTLNKPIYTVGDTLQFQAKLSYAGKPLSGRCRVKALVLKPGDDVGHLLATYPTPKFQKFPDVISPANLKLQSLMERNTKFRHALQPKNHPVELTSLGNGLFSGKFISTELTGVYNIVFLIEVELKGVGRIDRTTTLSTVFKFGNVDSHKPKIDVVSLGNGRKKLMVNIVPRNKYGYLMGPGFIPMQGGALTPKSRSKTCSVGIGSAIRVDIKGEGAAPVGKSQSRDVAMYIDGITDNLDGSYSIAVANVPDNTNPEISIAIYDEPLYDGKVWPVPMWLYALVVLFAIMLLIVRYSKMKSHNILRAILLIVTIGLLVIIYLHSKGIAIIF